MSTRDWQRLTGPALDEHRPWELFLENAKLSRQDVARLRRSGGQRSAVRPPALAFDPYPKVKLTGSALEAAQTRPPNSRMPSALVPCRLSLATLRTLLHRGLEVDADGAPRYSLELFVHTTWVDGLADGLYHFNAALDCLSCLRRHDQSHKIAAALPDQLLAPNSALFFFLVALPEITTRHAGDRGYRRLLLDGGAVARNLELAADALGLVGVGVDDYCDREVDTWLGLDGLTATTVQLLAVSGRAADDNS